MVKLKSIKLTFLFLFSAVAVMAVTKSEKITVNGSCEICKNRIENAVSSLDGVKQAQWDPETKKLGISYDDQKTSTERIQTAIAMAGHDTELFSASDKRYNELPGCCRYERDVNRKVNNHAVMGVQKSVKPTQSTDECVHDQGPNKGSCCDK